MSEGHDEDLSTAALLSASVSPLDYGSTKGDEQDYPSSNGYSLDPTGLAMVVSSSQFGALDAFNGVDGLASAINCGSISLGLSSDLIAYQRERYGSNETPTPSVPSLLELYVEQIKDPTLVMLLCSAVISLILGLGIERDFEHGWIEGTSILCTVFLVISVSAWTDYLKAIAFRDQLLELESEKHVDVIRSGLSVQLHPNELVVGDVMRLAVGDISPVDGVLVDGTDIKFDESALTGESELIGKTAYKRKGDRSGDPFVISGTNVMQGTGKILVLAVGPNSIQGKIMARISEDGEEDEEDSDDSYSGSQNGFVSYIKEFFTFKSFGSGTEGADLLGKLDVLAMDIGKIGLLIGGLVFFALVTSWFNTQFVQGGSCTNSGTNPDACAEDLLCTWRNGECERHWVTSEDLSILLDFFITAITILVVAVPEGLPLAVTLSLAISINRMMLDNNQVKHMDSCETMGSATTICSDKTGTLTENKMTVMMTMVAGSSYEHIVGRGGTGENLGQIILGASGEGKKGPLTDLLAESILVNCAPTSKVVYEPNGVRYEGNATECALLKLSMQIGYDPESVRNAFKEKDSLLDWGVASIPFSSEKKRMSWIIRREGSVKPFRMYCKGAPQQIFSSSTSFVSSVDGAGKIVVKDLLGFGGSSASFVTSVDGAGRIVVKDMGASDQTVFENKIRDYQMDGLRTLAIAFRDFDTVPKGGWENVSGDDLTLLAIFGIEDPIRASVPLAISECHKAGIDVRMCTGDALTTGIAIAKKSGILCSRDLLPDGQPKKNFAMTGAEFADLVHLKDPSKPKVIRRVFDPTINDAVDKLAEQFLTDIKGNKVIDQAAFDRIWPTLRVLARCQPEDKFTLVSGMRKSRVFMDNTRCQALKSEHGINIFPDFQVVAVTGDGTNDAPALKSANVGFSMGIVGTETAKQACDIILLDDNFSSIVKAVMWGRNVFDSISKFLQFQLTVNVVAITLATVGAMTFGESPLTPVQMLWINMIMDSLGSLALATELPTEELLERMPYGRRRPVISRVMLTNILGQSVYQLGVLLWVLLAPQTLPMGGTLFEPHQGSRHWSLFFNVFVMLQLFNELNSRRLATVEKLRTTFSEWNVFHGILSNKIFVAIMVSTFAIQVFMVQFGGIAVNLIPGGLSSTEWAFCVAAGAFGLVWQVILNLFVAFFCFESGAEEIKTIFDRMHSDISADEEVARIDSNALDNWSKLRLGVRQGLVYSKLLRVSIRTGFEIQGICKSSVMSAKAKEQAAKQWLALTSEKMK